MQHLSVNILQGKNKRMALKGKKNLLFLPLGLCVNVVQ